jgi:hypothetical protein
MTTAWMVRGARGGRPGARKGECGGHVEAPLPEKAQAQIPMTTAWMVRGARGGRPGARKGECGGHVEAPAAE